MPTAWPRPRMDFPFDSVSGNGQGQPALVPPKDPKFKEIVELTEWVSDCHPHKFRVEGNEVVVETS